MLMADQLKFFLIPDSIPHHVSYSQTTHKCTQNTLYRLKMLVLAGEEPPLSTALDDILLGNF